MHRPVIAILIALIIGAAVFLLAPTEQANNQQLNTKKFSDLQIELDRRAALPKATIDSPSQREIARERGLALYNDRAKLNMRRGLNITLVGFPGDNIITETAGTAECGLKLSAFASKCVVLAARIISKPSQGSRKRKVSLSLAFQEKGPPSIYQSSVQDRFRTKLNSIAMTVKDNDPVAARKKLYREIGDICSAFKGTGDCSLLAGEIESTYLQDSVCAEGVVDVGYLDPKT
jgi:hypothetical protein